MARFKSSVPELVVYLVKLASMARCAAAETCGGVGKSGSPAPKSTMSTPCAFSLSASAVTFIVGDMAMRAVRAASCMDSGPQRRAAAALPAQPLVDNGWHEVRDRAAERDHFFHDPRADIGIGFGRHHEHRLDLGVEVAVHERHLHLVLEIRNRAESAHDRVGRLG